MLLTCLGSKASSVGFLIAPLSFLPRSALKEGFLALETRDFLDLLMFLM